MSYATSEQSIHDGAPIEVYKFVGSFTTYRYTSSATEVTVNGEVYEPIFIQRGTMKAGTQEETNLALEVQVPFDIQMAIDYAYATTPPRLVMELRRYHKNDDPLTDWELIWTGKVKTFAVASRICKLTIPSVFGELLEGSIPSVYHQSPCNHTLYDPNCAVSRAANTTVSTVVAVDQTTVEVVDDGVADDDLAAGELIVPRTGERRLIMSNVVNLIQINFPFVDCAPGDTVQMAKGCDLARATCVNKFSNGDRFGGDPFTPGDNPFQGTL